MRLDSDFVVCQPCAGRLWMPRVQRWMLDLVCRLTGHVLHRTDSSRDTGDGSLPVRASYCRRCFKGGYIAGDYAVAR